MFQYDDDDERQLQTTGGAFKIPDRDFYRKNFSSFGTVVNYLDSRTYVRSFRDVRLQRPHFSSLVDTRLPYANTHNPADGVCVHFLRRGFTKPNKIQFNAAVWSADARWLVLGTQTGDLALWESEALKVHKVISIPAHKEFYGDGDRVKENVPITAMAWKHYGNVLVTGDQRGLLQYCDETFRNITVTKNAHTSGIRGLSFAPFDAKLASCCDDGLCSIWTVGRDRPDSNLVGHQSDVKCIEWHPYRGLIASGSRDSTARLWDARQSSCVSTISGHKKQINCLQWNQNGNWLATGSMDGVVKVYDIRAMREIEVWRGHNSEVCRIGWHPVHESLLLSGGYNGSLAYWIVGQSSSTPHTAISDAHRQSIDVMSWHPAGHLVATASHDCILKFWCREPCGAKLDEVPMESHDFPPVFHHGPIARGTQNVIPHRSSNVPGGEGGIAGAGSELGRSTGFGHGLNSGGPRDHHHHDGRDRRDGGHRDHRRDRRDRRDHGDRDRGDHYGPGAGDSFGQGGMVGSKRRFQS